jgi:hypothetical protein
VILFKSITVPHLYGVKATIKQVIDMGIVLVGVTGVGTILKSW